MTLGYCSLNLPGVDSAISHFVLGTQILHINVPGSADNLSVILKPADASDEMRA